MAYDLALDFDSWDLELENNDLILIDGAERIAQQILITLRFFYGEWFLDLTDGTPYLEEILVKTPNLAHVRQIISEKILSVEGVDSLDSLTLDYDVQKRNLVIEYETSTSYGLITRREVINYGTG